jgi:hypothetical protein
VLSDPLRLPRTGAFLHLLRNGSTAAGHASEAETTLRQAGVSLRLDSNRWIRSVAVRHAIFAIWELTATQQTGSTPCTVEPVSSPVRSASRGTAKPGCPTPMLSRVPPRRARRVASDRRTFWSFALIGGMAGALALFVGVSALVGVCAALVGALGLGFFKQLGVDTRSREYTWPPGVGCRGH